MRQISRSKFYYFKASWKFSVLIYRVYDMPVIPSSNLVFTLLKVERKFCCRLTGRKNRISFKFQARLLRALRFAASKSPRYPATSSESRIRHLSSRCARHLAPIRSRGTSPPQAPCDRLRDSSARARRPPFGTREWCARRPLSARAYSWL